MLFLKQLRDDRYFFKSASKIPHHISKSFEVQRKRLQSIINIKRQKRGSQSYYHSFRNHTRLAA